MCGRESVKREARGKQTPKPLGSPKRTAKRKPTAAPAVAAAAAKVKERVTSGSPTPPEKRGDAAGTVRMP